MILKNLDLAFNIIRIFGGIILSIDLLDKWDGKTKFFITIKRILSPLQIIIGSTLVILGIYSLVNNGSILMNIICILGGLKLVVNLIFRLKIVKNNSELLSELQASQKRVKPTQIILGLIILAFGVAELIKIL